MVDSSGVLSLRTALFVDDDLSLQDLVVRYLRTHKVDVVTAAGLDGARQLLRGHHFDVLILDLNLGLEEGTVLLREVAAKGAPPVIVVSARQDQTDRILTLELGADDYLTKPFHMRELLARINAVLRRTHGRQPHRHRAQFGTWTVDLTAHRVVDAAGDAAELTSGELSLLRVFLEHPNRVLPRHEMLALTDRDDAEVFDRTIDVLVSRLRAKLERDPRRPAYIKTIRRAGYRFDADVVWLD